MIHHPDSGVLPA